MKQYTIYFDVDDTLYDRSEPFRRSFHKLYSDDEKLAIKAYRACAERGDEVFLPSQRGEITMEEMYIYRYTKGFEDVGISISPEEALGFQEVYRENQKQIVPGKGVPELLEYCSKAFRSVGIITNGPARKQQDKIRNLGLSRWVRDEMILISGVLKVDKPDPAIFHMAEERAEAKAEQLIYVGDSFYNDIRPACSLGWKTIYLNRKQEELSAGDPLPDLMLMGEEALTPRHLEGLLR